MGWSTSLIVVEEEKDGYFGTLPHYRPEKATAVLGDIYPRAFRTVAVSNLLNELNPPKSHFAFGAYENGCILCDWYEVPGCVVNGEKEILRHFLTRFPKSSVFVLELASVTSSFGYALYEKQVLRRAYAADPQSGVLVDVGDPLPEEATFFEKSELQKGERFFQVRIGSQEMSFNTVAFGETLAFSVCRRFFGVAFDHFPAELLKVGRFRRV